MSGSSLATKPLRLGKFELFNDKYDNKMNVPNKDIIKYCWTIQVSDAMIKYVGATIKRCMHVQKSMVVIHILQVIVERLGF